MDWRRIQGRIRKARTSKDPAAELAALYTTTRDAMVAFELARLYEQNGNVADAVQWYTTAATRFRRAQWKVKAQEALTRLGAEVPLAATEAEAEAGGGSVADDVAHPMAAIPLVGSGGDEMETPQAYSEPSEGGPKYGGDLPEEDESEGQIALLGRNAEALSKAKAAAAAEEAGKKRRRRGRRGGARRRKHGAPVGPVVAGAPVPGPVHQRGPHHGRPDAIKRADRPVRESRDHRREPDSARPVVSIAASASTVAPIQSAAPIAIPPQAVVEPPAHETEGRIGPAAYQARTRAADPAVASRLAQLDSQLRRLLAGAAHSVAEAEKAPAGPGVFVVSDADMSGYYYVEACQTLRIGIGNVVRSGRSREGGDIKAKMAEHLGINESRVSAYLKEHCVVRWLQLDDGASLLAHFAIAVLRPVVNE
jgi:hypothetical protein